MSDEIVSFPNWVSASSPTMNSPDDWPMPLLSAEALPPLGCRITRTFGCAANSASTASAVPSFDPSSTKMNLDIRIVAVEHAANRAAHHFAFVECGDDHADERPEIRRRLRSSLLKMGDERQRRHENRTRAIPRPIAATKAMPRKCRNEKIVPNTMALIQLMTRSLGVRSGIASARVMPARFEMRTNS